MEITKIMIIDDSEADQFMAVEAIEEFDENIEILQAYDGQEALTALETLDSQPDLIFLDINMPLMNGHEFLAEYTGKKHHNAVIVMLTSSMQEKDKERAISFACVKNYVEKPLVLDNIKDILQTLEDV